MTETASGSAGRSTNGGKKRGSAHGVITRGLGGTPSGRKNSAQNGDLNHRLELHTGLRKAGSSLAVQARMGKIGLAAFLHAREVPGAESASCTCGWRKQDGKHILMFCPEREESRLKMLETPLTSDCETLPTTNAGLKASAQSL